MSHAHVIVIGAGIGGLSAAIDCARQGARVTVLERAAQPGGKMRTVAVNGQTIDAGPTVFTMRWVFERLFADAGTALERHLGLTPLDILARHSWSDGSSLDLFADHTRSINAVSRFAGSAEAKRFAAFCAQAARVYRTLEGPFIQAPSPSIGQLVGQAGLRGLGDLAQIKPFVSLWQELGNFFHDPRLRQLFARYATYCGASPFEAPATLMLIAHVEQAGVWSVDGGMHKLAQALADLAQAQGATIRYGAHVAGIATAGGAARGVTLADGERLSADAVLVNADAQALAAGKFGAEVTRAVPHLPRTRRSLSALTWAVHGRTEGFALARHNVFFCRDYRAEFADIFRRDALPREPTVYVCAQDRAAAPAAPDGAERLLILVNAPPCGDRHAFPPEEIASCATTTLNLLAQRGLRIAPDATWVPTSPAGFERLFPATGGALYGMANHGWAASFNRPTARSALPGLYLAGGSAHPGAGVPMAALSGRMAATALLSDLTSIRPSRRTAMSGGMSMR